LDATNGESAPEPKRATARTPVKAALRIVAIYAVVAVTWILFSDQLARLLFTDPDVLTRVASEKGALFVLVTSVMLFLVIRSYLAQLEAASRKLRESERRFRRIVDVSPVPIAVSDVNGSVTLTNAEFTSLFGYTGEDIPTLSRWWELAYPDPEYRREMMETWQRESERSQKEGDAFVPVPARITCKDGDEKFALVGSAELDPDTAERIAVFYDLTDRELAEQSILTANAQLASVLKDVITLIGKIVEARDPYTKGHEVGVARIARLIAEELGFSSEDIEGIEVAGLVHDVGKLGVPVEILSKPRQLTAAEYDIIKTHPAGGYEILKSIDFGWPVAEMVQLHHERMDGSGYPQGLSGDEIPMAARVLMVADVVEAMAADRPYRAALGHVAAINEITSHPEKFDPLVAEACVRLYEAGRLGL
jgi:PAS domain S-box-containing protein